MIIDRANDVQHSLGEGDDHPKHIPYPRVDLRRVTITHGRLRVKVVEHIGKLRPAADYQQFQVQVHGPHLTYVGYAQLGHTRGSRAALDVRCARQVPDPTSGMRTVRCAGRSGRADFARNLLVFVIPTRCLGSPPWVSLTVWNVLGDPDGEDYEDMLDPAQTKANGYSAPVSRR